MYRLCNFCFRAIQKSTLSQPVRLISASGTQLPSIGSAAVPGLRYSSTGNALPATVSVIGLNHSKKHILSDVNHFGIAVALRQRSNESRQDRENEETQMKENILTVPNLLTVMRMISVPVIGYFVLQDTYTVALALYVTAAVSDVADGYIARNFKNQSSSLGTVIDPLADKLLINTLTITLTVAGMLPVLLAAVIVGRDVLLIATGIYIRYTSLSPPRTLKRYFDVRQATAKVYPSNISKLNTLLQNVLISCALAAPVVGFVDHPLIHVIWYLTGATTIISGIDYVLNRDKHVKILKDKSDEKSGA